MPRAGRAALRAADFWDASRGFSLVWVTHLGRRHGLLRALAASRSPLTANGLASRTGLDRAAVRLWCEAAAALGLVSDRGARYSLPPPLRALVVDEASPRYLGGHLDYLALRSLDYDAFDPFFRDGRPSARRPRYLIQAFEEATKWDHTAFVEVLLPRAPTLKGALAAGADVLDVGAGAGAWSFRVAERFPRSRFVGIEPDRTALRMARAKAAAIGLDERVSFEVGSGEKLPYRGRFDVAFLGEILCATDQATAVLARARRALRPGGHLVVAEGLVDEGADRADPGNALVMAMRLEFALQPAQLFNKRDLARLIGAAGFARPRFVSAGGGFYFAHARA